MLLPYKTRRPCSNRSNQYIFFLIHDLFLQVLLHYRNNKEYIILPFKMSKFELDPINAAENFGKNKSSETLLISGHVQ